VLLGSVECQADLLPSTRLRALDQRGNVAALQTDQEPHSCTCNEPQSQITAQQRMKCDALIAILRSRYARLGTQGVLGSCLGQVTIRWNFPAQLTPCMDQTEGRQWFQAAYAC